MDFEHIDKEKIIEVLGKKAARYVPEWRFDPDNPDIGTALALVYAQMYFGTVKKLQYIPYKNEISFFNCLEAKLLPAEPSKGYVSFRMTSDEMEGQEMPAGMEVVAPSKNAEQESVNFETLDDVFVTPARVNKVMEVNGEKDYIGMTDLGEDETFENGISLLNESFPNLQEHEMFFCHDYAFGILSGGVIHLNFTFHEENVSMKYLDALIDRGNVEFAYSTMDGYVNFKSIKRYGGKLQLVIGKNDPDFETAEEGGRESYWIRCRLKSLSDLEKFCFDRLRFSVSRERLYPPMIYANEQEVKRTEFFPFGTRFSNYNEVYILSDEVLQKKDALITMAFNLDFVRVPLNQDEKDETDWNWVMKKGDFKPDLEYDITIEEVVWEYYNGYGWTSLTDEAEHKRLFSASKGVIGSYHKIEFICPHDLEPILINAIEGCYIRARIAKVNNLYKQKGYYIAPVMDNVSFDYSYEGRQVGVQALYVKNNMERVDYYPDCEGNMTEVTPFYAPEDKAQVLYLGFDIAPVDGPIKMLFDFTDNLKRKDKNMVWEYYGCHGWKEIDLVDETENMSRMGLVTLIGNRDYVKLKQYGQEMYWIRITNSVDDVRDKSENTSPVLAGIYMNSVKVRQRDMTRTQYFHMEVYQENIQFSLLEGKIIECQVYVDELGIMTKEELEEALQSRMLFPEYKENGELLRAWVQWEQVGDFLNSTSADRHYCLDHNAGIIRFGNGNAGRIPPTGRTDNIRVTYKTGGGNHTNVKSGDVSQMGSYVGYISNVTNRKRMSGGNDIENLISGLKRNASVLRHQNMAVTARDFEEIALAASRNIRKVKCFSGLDEFGKKKSGVLTLVLLQKDYKLGRTKFYDIKTEVENYMRNRIADHMWERQSFHIVEPTFVEFCIKTEIFIQSFDDVFHVRKCVLAGLKQFLNPLSGNFNGTGWEIGTLPNLFQIRNVISDSLGGRVAHIKNVYMNVYTGEATNRQEVEWEKIQKEHYILPVNGVHDIVVRVV